MSEETYTLVQYEQIPDYIDVFLVPDSEIPDQVRDWLNQANGKVINGEDQPNEGTVFLESAALQSKHRGKGYSPEQVPIEYECWLRQYEVKWGDEFVDKHISAFVRSAFIL